MLSYIFSVFNYFYPKVNQDDIDEVEQEKFLNEELLDIELSTESYQDLLTNDKFDIPRTAVCFQRTGVITFKDDIQNYVLIDGALYFELSACSFNLYENDKVLYVAYKDKNDSIVVVRILENQGMVWGDMDTMEEENFNVIEHVIVGEVARREERMVHLQNSNFKFNLDDVEGTFIPIIGDWIEMKCSIQWDENKPADISAAQVLQVISFKPIRRKLKNVTVTDWMGDFGVCDRQIYFNRTCLENGFEPKVGSKVMVEAIESNQSSYSWRVLKMISLGTSVDVTEIEKKSNDEELSLKVEKEKNIDMIHPVQFSNVNVRKSDKIDVHITNNSNQTYTMNKWIVLSKKRDSQINIKPFISQPIKLYPKESFTLQITCHPKFLGNAKECLVIMFRGFQLKRYVDINIVDDNLSATASRSGTEYSSNTRCNSIQSMKKIWKNGDRSVIPGVRPVRPPNFIPVKLGLYPIPEKIWSAVLGNTEQTIYSSDYDKIVGRISSTLPCLLRDLDINNYIDKWHTLLYMEEIQMNISMRVYYDMPKVFLTHCQEYLCVEIKELSERRPSLIKGDRVIVTDVWNDRAPKYEGYIHDIKGDLVFLKFNPSFQNSYSGTDLAIEFHFSRTTYRRSHQAINLALSNLGPDILFPSRLTNRPPLLSAESLKSIKWYNDSLNSCQKAAVTNILTGECRPLPYCIYGPPGTGKTVTVIELILQILTLHQDSRILVATPSNSASNLITERLIKHESECSNSIIRLIANYLLDSPNIPDAIKPYCATLDIAKEDTALSKYEKNRDGINMHCRSSFIGRHRVIIGTCYCLGTLAQMGFPKGHFTHIIVDEAGQATEPEIMIPLTFTDKENGQIILAGDPMQLGPVIMSKYCKDFGMDESYLSRILETFPYQRDYDAYENGFNSRLVTKLNYNYRSLQEIISLPSEMFYDGSLIPKINRNELWISKILEIIGDIFDIEDKTVGGIFTYGIKGCNLRAEDSPSWYNPQEASMVALTTCKLYKGNISVDDIGIITPYIAQTKYLRTLFDAMGLPQPKIGTVEEFQGQERPIVLISTVRSTESHLGEDQKHTLGFIKNPKRLNVALTRAQVAVLLFCNPHLLCRDPLWQKVISYSVKADKYMGCDLPDGL